VATAAVLRGGVPGRSPIDDPARTVHTRYRLVYRNEPSDGAVQVMVVLAIGRRENMIAYAKASARLARPAARQVRSARRLSPR
jgi:hypothetical protein